MKKKIIVLMGALALFTTATFANVEMRINYFGIPELKFNATGDNSTELNTKASSGFGMSEGFNFYFGKSASFFEAGLGLDYGFAVLNNSYEISAKSVSNNFSDADSFFGINCYFNIGPTFRFTVADIHSFTVTPSFGLNFSIAEAIIKDSGTKITQAFSSIGFMFNINLGYRIWLLNTSGFHLGINAGLDLGVPLVGGTGFAYTYGTSKDSKGYEIQSGVSTRFSLGLVMNFGDRGVDR